MADPHDLSAAPIAERILRAPELSCRPSTHFSVPAPRAGEDYLDAGPDVGGVPTRDVDEVLMTAPFNIASRCPVLAAPERRPRLAAALAGAA